MKIRIFILLILTGTFCFAQENKSTVVLTTNFRKTVNLNIQINDFHYEITKASFSKGSGEALEFLQAYFVTANGELYIQNGTKWIKQNTNADWKNIYKKQQTTIISKGPFKKGNVTRGISEAPGSSPAQNSFQKKIILPFDFDICEKTNQTLENAFLDSNFFVDKEKLIIKKYAKHNTKDGILIFTVKEKSNNDVYTISLLPSFSFYNNQESLCTVCLTKKVFTGEIISNFSYSNNLLQNNHINSESERIYTDQKEHFEPLKKTYWLSEEILVNNIFEILSRKNYSSEEYKAAQNACKLITESIKNNETKNFCEVNKVIKAYLNMLYENNIPLYSENEGSACEGLSIQEGMELAENAEKYTYCAAEYKLNNVKYEKPLFNKVEANWKKEKANQNPSKNDYYPTDLKEFIGGGNPLPYSKDGFDTPRTFWYKMYLENKKTKCISKLKKEKSKFQYSDFCAGGKKCIYKNAGTDSFGLFTGAVSMSDFASQILSKQNITKAVNLQNYSKNILSLTSESSRLSFMEKADECRFNFEDIKNASVIICDYSKIRAGDLLLYKDSNKSQVCIVYDTGNGKTINDFTVITINETENSVAQKMLWSELENAQNFYAARLLKRISSNAPDTEENKYKLVSSNIKTAFINFKSSYEEDGVPEEKTKWKWIPNTGEYLKINSPRIELLNASGLKIEQKETDSIEIDELYLRDRNYDETKTDSSTKIYTNIYCNNPKGEIQLILQTENGEYEYGVFKKNLSENKKLYRANSTINEKITIDSNGNLILSNGQKIKSLKVRPSEYKKSFPGDDFYIGMKLKINGKQINAETSNNDYFAVYDKKLLWRANLYMNKIETCNLDWNEVHPWDVPNSENETMSEKKWWNAQWGINEWNFLYNGSTYIENTKLLELQKSHGGQTVSIQPFVPARTYRDNKKKEDDRLLLVKNTIPYNYPKYIEEKLNEDTSGMDSPFACNWKLSQQIKLRNEEMKKENKNISLDDWVDYKKADKNTFYTETFLPSLGTYYKDKNSSNVNFFYKDKPEIDNNYNYETGTDCIGFSQRSASYSGNRYTWPDLPDYIMESDKETYKDKVNSCYTGNKYRTYPRDNEEAVTNSKNQFAVSIVSANSKNYSFSNDEIEKLKKIVPGDIFVKGNINDKNSHIAIVSDIPEDLESLNEYEILKSIKLIESTCTNIIQSVVKIFTLADYNFQAIQEDKNIYDGITFKAGNLAMDTNSWAIRRLIINEN